MLSNKDRLYIALYARGVPEEPDTYHWALMVCPKANPRRSTRGVRYHVKNTIQLSGSGRPWVFEQKQLSAFTTQLLLARVLIAKVQNSAAVLRTVQTVPLVQNDRNWTCRIWVREALAQLNRDGVLGRSKVTNWQAIENKCKQFVASKKAAGRWRDRGKWKDDETPTWDMLQGRETVP